MDACRQQQKAAHVTSEERHVHAPQPHSPARRCEKPGPRSGSQFKQKPRSRWCRSPRPSLAPMLLPEADEGGAGRAV
eukprot:1383149-Rhodomonas_salina.1